MGTCSPNTCSAGQLPWSTSAITPQITMADNKPSAELQDAIKSADVSKLKDVTPVENPAAKHDMTMYGIEKFNKDKLNPTETVEKNSLPSAEDIKAEKST